MFASCARLPRGLLSVWSWVAALLIGLGIGAAADAVEPLGEDWDYAPAMRRTGERFRGRAGVVVHFGDSITYSNPYGQWARNGRGRTAADLAILAWMHAGADDDTDGWRLARFDHPDGGRSLTAASGLRADQALAGGHRGLPPLEKVVAEYRPQIVVLMLGTNDASAGRPVDAYRADMQRAVDTILETGAICILSTIPPHPSRGELAGRYNVELRTLARRRSLPLIDYEREILSRRPDDWNGTLLARDDVHPSAKVGEVDAASEPTVENLRTSGYLLRGWLTVRKIAEVKRRAIDGAGEPVRPAATPAPTTPAAGGSKPAPRGERLRAPVVRDTWFSNVGTEADGGNGGSPQLKLKSIQEMSLVDLDPTPLRGRTVLSATLHLHRSAEPVLRRVTVGTFASEWHEGKARSYAIEPGGSTHNRRRHPDLFWAQPGSDLCSVMLGIGGSFWRMADAEPPDADGWQQIPVDPQVVAARTAGVSHGFLLFDDTGTEWSRDGERFQTKLFPNRFVHSRESGPKTAPYFTLELGPSDDRPPAAPTGLSVARAGLPPGEALLAWISPADAGPAGTIGYFVTIDGRPAPRYLIPRATAAGARVEMRLRDVGLAPGAEFQWSVAAVDGAGNVGAAVEASGTTAPSVETPWPVVARRERRPSGSAPTLGKARIAVVDALDKLHPVRGELIPAAPADYWTANHLWSTADGRPRITLASARNEFTAFQVVVRGPVEGLKASLSWNGRAPVEATWLRFRHVQTPLGPLPDPLVPLDGPFSVPAGDESIEGQSCGSLVCELYASHDAAPGDHAGRLILESGAERLEIPVELRVWEFTLPDALSFLPEMNCYDLPANERDYYRLAHRHRTVLNRVPYYQNGRVAAGCAPDWDGRRLNWEAWDRRFGPLLDGSAFADLPRAGEPIECFYLPLHENWPSPIEPNYNGDYWADRAFTPEYRAALVAASRQMAEHFDERGWNRTLFHAFWNGKNNFKERGWSRGSSPWLLDEPANWQDYWALRYFGAAFHEGVRAARDARPQLASRMLFRADISRPEWQRDALDGLLDYNVVGGALRRYRRIVMDRKRDEGQIVVEYGGTNAVVDSNLQPVGWSLSAWALGADGVLPWQTVGSEASWKQADELSLFYPGGPVGLREPVPSVRLKAYRTGQQLVEYLTLWCDLNGVDRRAAGERLAEALRIEGERRGTGFTGGEDAGVIQFGELRAERADEFRRALGEALSAKRPSARKQLVDRRTPPRDPSRLASFEVSGRPATTEARPSGGPAGGAPMSKPSTPGRTIVVQGRKAVRDALLDFERPDKPLGGEARENALRRADRGAPFLVRFDLAAAGAPAGAKVRRATLSVFVWDPSAKGATKLVAAPLKSAWDEAAVNWRQATADRPWSGKEGFDPQVDAGRAGPPTIVRPEAGADTADPPIEYRLDVTEAVRAWAAGDPNYGLAVLPVPDRTVDDGQWSRFQIYASEHRDERSTPKLTIELEP